jgi:hypothetical protein
MTLTVNDALLYYPNAELIDSHLRAGPLLKQKRYPKKQAVEPEAVRKRWMKRGLDEKCDTRASHLSSNLICERVKFSTGFASFSS